MVANGIGRVTVEPGDSDALDEDDEEHGWSDGYFVHEIDNVITAVGTRGQGTQIADDQYAEHEQRAMASEEIRKFITQTRDDRFQTAELDGNQSKASPFASLTVLSMPNVMSMKKNSIAHTVDQFISAMVCG
jgi:hypothetical protein